MGTTYSLSGHFLMINVDNYTLFGFRAQRINKWRKKVERLNLSSATQNGKTTSYIECV